MPVIEAPHEFSEWLRTGGISPASDARRRRADTMKRLREASIHFTFNLAFGAALLAGALAAILLINHQEKRQALQDAEKRALILLDRNLATHTYFTNQLKPRVMAISDRTNSADFFDPAWMSSTYAVREIDRYFNSLSGESYYYKECAINARTLLNEADGYERDFIKELNSNPDLVVRTGVRTIEGSPYFFVLRRGERMEETCLRCHSTPDRAPGMLRNRYGSEKSFGREVDETVSAFSIRIPLAAAYGSANRFSLRLSAVMGVFLSLLFLAQYLILRRMVLRPLRTIRDRASRIAGSEESLGERITPPAGRELMELTEAFNAMSIRLGEKRDRLKDRVRERTEELARANRELETDNFERKRIEESLRRSEARFHAVFDRFPVGIALVDIRGRIVDTNPTVSRMLGYSQEELKTMTTADVTHPDDLPAEKKLFEDLFAGEKDLYQLEKRYYRKDGSLMWGRISSALVREADGKPEYAIKMVEDITDQKRFEEEILKAQKLESVGLLAGGIAHDFNNYLTAILGNISLAKMKSSPGEKTHEWLTEAEEIAYRARMLTHQLLIFSKGGAPVRKTSPLNNLLVETAEFALHGSNVKASFSIREDLWPGEVDEGQISQVITNLVVNAEESMPHGGTITIAAENALLSAEDLPPVEPGRYIRIRVADTGVGIPQENLERVFDPYFTTKAKGSGLGLAAAYSIIRKHGGVISVDSIPGKGSTFSVLLPASEKRVQAVTTATPQTISAGRRILVMDDEESVRSLIGAFLEKLGFEAVLAKDGAEAVGFYRQARERNTTFDAVILDLTVPGGMGGAEALKSILEVDRGARVIVSSGYSDDPVMANYRNHGFRGVLEKPYRLNDLHRTLMEVLGS